MTTPTLTSIVESHTLQWIFVGGKGGVGKTTTSCSLACLLARTPFLDPKTNARRPRRVLIISTDPAQNVSDAFNQAFTKAPTPVKGIENLDAMEVDPSSVTDGKDYFSEWNLEKVGGTAEDGESLKSVVGILKSAATTLPGIDEVTVFVEIIREVKRLHYDVVIFDTAPTGHTLRLLALPHTLNDSVDKLMQVQGLSGLLTAAAGPSAHRVYQKMTPDDKAELRNIAESRLRGHPWRQDMQAFIKDVVKEKIDRGDPIVIGDIVAEVLPHARVKVPEEVRKELLEKIRTILLGDMGP